jgi:hypothetical protein
MKERRMHCYGHILNPSGQGLFSRRGLRDF